MIRKHSPLLTDLYQLAMLHGYYQAGMHADASFDFFVRSLPDQRNFLVAAGLEQVLEYLENTRFTDSDIRWLASTGNFPERFLDGLREWRFHGDVWAMPEGRVFFADEPILSITAPLAEAQLVESRVINLLHLQTLIASKAARCRLVAPDQRLIDFGLRRAHGAEAGLLAARACYLAGYDGTATVLAGEQFGIPIFGTMAHSYIQAHASETAAFESFARARPQNLTLLIDTYDTEAAARKIVERAADWAGAGITVRAVRLDSGDLADHARQVREILDRGGLSAVGIFCSGGLDEYRIQALLATGAAIDGFGIGSRVDTSADAPYLDCAYKLCEYAGRARRKRSEGKANWPGRKQVCRHYERGRMCADLIQLRDETAAGESLLRPVMRAGRRVIDEDLARARERCSRDLAALPDPLRVLEAAPAYPVEISAELRALARECDRASTPVAAVG